ncbi:MAG: hypothetical protein LBL61_02410 [Elusimicrobiota bacterium]|jgi:hypothetical protein|nr:hypothetical protein [Elusimicrobiota bacterium]
MKKIILLLIIALPVCAFCAAPSDGSTARNKKQIKDKNIIIRNDDIRNILTSKYLDDGVIFQGKDNLGADLPDPWLLPDNIDNIVAERSQPAPCTALLRRNEEAIKDLYSDPENIRTTCKNVDAAFTHSAEETQKLIKSLGDTGVFYAFFDGGNVAMPRGCYYDNMARALLGAGAVNIASEDNIIDLQNVKEEDKDNLILIVPTALVQKDLQDFGFHSAVFEGNIPTPEGIEDFAASVVDAARELAQTARDKNTTRKAEELKKVVAAAVESAPKNPTTKNQPKVNNI